MVRITHCRLGDVNVLGRVQDGAFHEVERQFPTGLHAHAMKLPVA